MDYELWLRLGTIGPLHYAPEIISNFRFHSTSKSTVQAVSFWGEYLTLLEQFPELKKLVSPTLLEEARRRINVKAFLEHLYAEDPETGLKFLESALTGEVWPFGSPQEMALRLIDHIGLTGRSLTNSPNLIQSCLGVVASLSNHKKSKILKRALLSYELMRQVFLGYEKGNWVQVRKHIWHGLTLDPSWLRNRGIWSILSQAYMPVLPNFFRR